MIYSFLKIKISVTKGAEEMGLISLRVKVASKIYNRVFFIGGAGGALPSLKLVKIWYMY